MVVDVILPHVSFFAIKFVPTSNPQHVCMESLSPHSDALLDVDTMRSVMPKKEEEDINMFKAIEEKVDDDLLDQALLELDIPHSKVLVKAIVSLPLDESVDVVSNSF